MKLVEIITPATTTKEMVDIAKQLMAEYRAIAAKHDITIDGSRGAHDSLPMVRKDYILFGGRLKIKGTQKQEEKRTVGFQKRVYDFLEDLWPKLGLLQVDAIGDDLEENFKVLVRIDDGVFDSFDSTRLFKTWEASSVDEVYRALRFKDSDGIEVKQYEAHGPVNRAIFTWKLVRSR